VRGTIAVRRRLVLVPYAAVVAAAFVAFVRWYEEPTLAWQFGDRYQAYRVAVPGWWPRRHPWRPAGDD
jgi:protein-S-isoprenylcysteine O-methyltransferase Ste14